MRIEIKGVQFVNQGAHLMLLAVLDWLRGVVPEAEIVLAANPNSPVAQRRRHARWGKRVLRWRALDLNPLWARLPAALRVRASRTGELAECDIDAVLDASGYAYGDPWSVWALRYTAAELERRGRGGRPYVFLPQAFGPFGRHRAAARGFGQALRRAALVCARDPQSREFLLGLDPALGPRLRLYPDFTAALAGDPAAARRHGVDRRSLLIVPNINMAGPSRDVDGEAARRYVALLAGVASAARALGCEPRLLNHEGAADAALCRRVAAQAGGLDIIEDPDPLATKGVIGAAGFVIASRFHACVNALSQQVPCLGTSWNHKYAALFADYGVRDWLLDGPDAAAALRRLAGWVGDRETAAAQLGPGRIEVLARTGEMWAAVADALAAAPGRR